MSRGMCRPNAHNTIDRALTRCTDRSAGQMPKDVRQAVLECFRNVQQLSQDDAEAVVRSLEKSARYVTETWS
jgi:hypothetical protein